MPSELMQATEKIDALVKSFEQFKKDNDAEIKQIKDKGHADPLLTEKVNKHNDALTKMEQSVEEIKTALNRPNQGAQTVDDLDKKEKELVNKLYRKHDLSPEDKGILKNAVKNFHSVEEFKTLSADINIDGGYFVRPQVATEMGKKLFESSPLRQLSTVMSISANSLEMPYDNDEPDSEWLGERQSPTNPTDNNEISMLKFDTHIISANPRATQTLLDDASIDIESWHMGKVLEKFSRAEATAFVSGSGVGRPKGFTAYASGDAFNSIEQVNSGHATTFTADGLLSVQTALFEQFQANAVWLMRRATAGVIRKLKDNEGLYLWATERGLNNAVPATLLGKPVHFCADLDADGVASNLAAAYGDFKAGYLIVDRIGVRVLRDPYSSKPFISFYTTKRVGGGVKQFQAIKLQKLSA